MARNRGDSTPADIAVEGQGEAGSSTPVNGAATPEGGAAATVTTTPVGTGDDRYVMVTRPSDGVKVKRQDYIRQLWAEGKMTRGAIAKHLTELNAVDKGGSGKKVPYQIVFAATKKLPGGPPKDAAATATPAQPSA